MQDKTSSDVLVLDRDEARATIAANGQTARSQSRL